MERNDKRGTRVNFLNEGDKMASPGRRGDTIMIHAVGDVLVNREDPDSMFVHTASTIREADIAFCQVETTYSERGGRQIWAPISVRAHPRNAPAIKNAGFTVASLAGNHCGDYGHEALVDTIDLLKGLGLETMGAGKNIEEARRPAIVEKKGVKVGFLAYNTILPQGYWAEANRPGCAPMRALTFYEPVEPEQPGIPCRILTAPHPKDFRDMIADITKLRQVADLVIVSHHWGLHFLPGAIADYQREVGHAAIDAGADLILGHHAHILKGVEIYKNKAILYSMGNFAFDSSMTKERFESPLFQERKRLLHPHWEYDPKYPNYFFPADSRKTLLFKIVMQGKRIVGISFLPADTLNTKQPEFLKRQDPRSQQVFDYMDWLNREAGFDTRMSYEGDEVVIALD
jgi:poly-gamma-glutamate capsule biosynthesis protein CapA/YwtB (metallophosphatase superfamily)